MARFRFPCTQPDEAARHVRAGQDLNKKIVINSFLQDNDEIRKLIAPLPWPVPAPGLYWWAVIDVAEGISAILLTEDDLDDLDCMNAYEAERFVAKTKA